MKLVAVLACRNQSSRLYAKPLQNLDVDGNVSILEYLIAQIRLRKEIAEIVLAVSEEKENTGYVQFAGKRHIPYVMGSDRDVLARLISGARLAKATHVLRVTTESPYIYFDNLPQVYQAHCEGGIDYSVTTGVPDGSFYEIISLTALEESWERGDQRHRSELCTLYIFEHQEKFKISRVPCPAAFNRPDMRLTVDWPEDLIVLREIYQGLKLDPQKPLNYAAVIEFLAAHPKISAINQWIDSGTGRIWY